ncbi:Carrier protein, mitochondrial [Chamberlinius hualienensis]
MEFAEVIKTPKVDNVILQFAGTTIEGTLCITGHHLIISSRKGNEEFWLLHSSIDSVDKKVSNMLGGSLTLKCKDFKIVHLEVSGVEQCNNVASSLECLSSLADPMLSYPFFYRAMFDVLEDGWNAFSVSSEFGKLLNHTDNWRISNVNKNFEVCVTYPQAVVVPKCIDDECLVISASFRQNGRFPVLSYYHNDSGAVLLRCSQPMVGPNGRRCKEDERLLNAALSAGKRGYIIDTRTQNFAQMAKAKGGGFEPEVHYPNWRRVHKAIDRYHVLMDSLCKLIEACNDVGSTVDRWLSRLETSNWISHVKDVLDCACLVAQCVDKDGASVLVHGSDGADTTLQVTSIAQVLLDPDCRTVRGFEALIEREWIQAGFPFATRCQKSVYAVSNLRAKSHSPVFLLFLDIVWQIHNQFPCSFEFNEQFLCLLFEHSYFSEFGTFLGNCEKDRKEMKCEKRTTSLWSYVNRPVVLQNYLNPLYEPHPNVLWPSVAPMSLDLWSGLYLRWVLNQSSQQKVWKYIMDIKEKDKALRSYVNKLRRQVVELENEAVEAGIMHSRD